MKKQILFLILGCCIGLIIGSIVVLINTTIQNKDYNTKISELETKIKEQEVALVTQNKNINSTVQKPALDKQKQNQDQLNLTENSTQDNNQSKNNTSTISTENKVSTTTANNTKEETTNQTTQKTSITMGQKNALSSAKSYLSFMAFSYSGLVKQLEYEGYSHEESTYAANNCGANWNEQAAKSAKSYISIMSFSKSELTKQLEYEGFTHSQAEYGVKAVGY